MTMHIFLTSVRPIAGGEETELSFLIDGGDFSERKKLVIAAEMFFPLGFPLEIVKDIEIDTFKFDEISFLADKTAAIKRGIYILSFGDNTKKALARKLTEKGFSKEVSAEAAEYLAEMGYINEEESAKLLASDMANKKLYGPRRIKGALYEKGFSKDICEIAVDSLNVDFSKILAKRISKMRVKPDFSDEKERKKAIASFLRLGFSYDDLPFLKER